MRRLRCCDRVLCIGVPLMRPRIRNWFYCLWNGHQYRKVDTWGGWYKWQCRVCGAVDRRL
ncbi:hypothetical protein SEA_MOLIVIA_6 [Arthrobacter phage Molivia]|uniref:Uncharacterized protein n=1 Tax=Arthrobacter phage Molivia TaxID=2015839 RepID=A0A286S1V5_9CAUD|nr:hypothetical protein FDI28_gp06 [Arthrobacter phage Molivia]ASX99320.1 hypothetical protein SEA_MOLIVIA_6 [Arthrobacter phage Molivia]